MKKNLSLVFVVLAAAALAGRIAFGNHDLSGVAALFAGLAFALWALHARESGRSS
jgi:hypothetical protein